MTTKPKPLCPICEGEGQVLTGMSIHSTRPVELVPCPKCTAPLDLPPMPRLADDMASSYASWALDLEAWGRQLAEIAQAQARRADEAEAQRKHDDEADTACRNLLCEERDQAEAERDALKARVAELENGSFAKRQGATLETYRIERNEARATLAQRDREVLALRSALEREHCSGVIPPDTCITRSNPTELRCPRCYALASTAQAGAGAERRVRQDERERCAIAIWHKDQDRRWTKGEIRAFMEPEADILGTEPNP